MNDEQQAILTQSIKEVLSWLEAAKGFTAEQAPVIAQEMLRWGVVDAVFAIVLGAGLLAATWGICRYAMAPTTQKNHNDKDETESRWSWWSHSDNEPACIASVTGGITTLVLGGIFLPCGLYSLLFVLITPRLYIIHELGKLVN